MNNDLIALLFWLFGWLLLSIGYFIYKIYIDKDHKVTKKVHAWRAFWIGFWSWIGIIFIFSFAIVGIVTMINEWIEDKLNK